MYLQRVLLCGFCSRLASNFNQKLALLTVGQGTAAVGCRHTMALDMLDIYNEVAVARTHRTTSMDSSLAHVWLFRLQTFGETS